LRIFGWLLAETRRVDLWNLAGNRAKFQPEPEKWAVVGHMFAICNESWEFKLQFKLSKKTGFS
jgi:hypothetical protein